MRTDAGALLSLCLCLALAAPLRAQEPLSAIDWLSESVALPERSEQGTPLPGTGIGPLPEEINVAPLDGPTSDAVGLLPAAQSGLPRGLWGVTPTQDLAARLRAEQAGPLLPALQDLQLTLLLTELDPPLDAAGSGALFLARIDKLLDLGALDQAMALLDRAGTTSPESFRRWFDIALLMGQEDRACVTMRARPEIAPTIPARIYCLARGGDWNAAALTLHTGQALGLVTREEDVLLSRFLDPELADEAGLDPLPPPSRPSPLVWRMLEAIGEPLSTTTLPLAFAQADLRGNSGWKARLEAAERLVRTGALSENVLLGLYTERKPAASGGVWERVAAIQRFEAALESGDMQRMTLALTQAWDRMAEAELEVPFARLYAARLAALPLEGAARALAFRIGLLSPEYEARAGAHDPADATEIFLKGLAQGNMQGLVPPNRTAAAVRDGFRAGAVPAEIAAMAADNRLGETILIALERVTEGAKGDLRSVTEGIALLRHLGLEDTARQAGLQLLLLDRRG